MKEYERLKKKYGNNHCLFTLNLLRFPAYQSVLILPQNMRNMYADQLIEWLKINEKNLHGMEAEHVKRLITYLHNPNNKYDNQQFIDSQKYFKRYHDQYDIRRNKDFKKTFSKEMVEWYGKL